MAGEYNLTWLNPQGLGDFKPQLKAEMAKIGLGVYAQNHMAAKGAFLVLRAENIKNPGANILKQEFLAKGAEVAVHPMVVVGKAEFSSVVMMATEKQYQLICEKLKLQQFGLPNLGLEIAESISNLQVCNWQIIYGGNQRLELGNKTLIMGILNLTPDSFSDGGSYADLDEAVVRAEEMVAQGASIIDIGGESTRPGYQAVTEAKEIARVVPVIEAIKAKLNVPISIDSYKPGVVKAALEAGADIINDIWGLQSPADPDGQMAKLAAAYKAPVVVMHNQNGTEYGQANPNYMANPSLNIYGDLLGDVTAFFRKSMAIGQASGMSRDQFVLDVGFGFGKDYQQNLEVLNKMAALKILGRPLLIGTSRKSTLGKITGREVDDRAFATAATLAVGIQNGADIARVHDIEAMIDVAKTTDAIIKKGVKDNYEQ